MYVALYYFATEMDEVGHTVFTPIDLFLGHFKEVKLLEHSLSVKVGKERLYTFYKSEWHAYNVGWPLQVPPN